MTRPWTMVLALSGVSCMMTAGMAPEDNEEVALRGGFYDEAELGDGDMPAPAAKERAQRSAPMDMEQSLAEAPAEMDQDRLEGAKSDDAGGSGAEEPARTRAWFPETFLWQPLVETDADGTAEVAVRVPDRLTSWRVLGLAHTEGGQQSGAVHRFASVQDVYVDPVIPNHLYVGDRIDLPVQAVNTSTTARDLVLDVKGGASLEGGLSTPLKVVDGGSAIRNVSLKARFAGSGMVEASLGGADRVLRQVEVRPVGKPHLAVAGGSLTDSRAFRLSGPSEADPSTQELMVQVYPGGLAVLQAELDRLGGGGTVVDPAYGFAVTSTLERLSMASGSEVDVDAVRRVRQQAWQRLVREAGFDPDARRLVSLVGALREVSGHELAAERRELWAQRLADSQRADGTFAPSDRGTVQALIVQTATAAWVLPEDEAYDTVRSRAASALERLSRQIDDPYTAAVVASTGLLDGARQEALVQRVIDATQERSDGSRTLPSPGRLHSGFGAASKPEFLAWARLALDGRDDLAWRDDLVAELMSGYGARGFGAARGDVVALAAVARALPTVSQPVEVVLLLDDQEVARGGLDPAQPRTPVRLAAAPQAGDPRYTLEVVGDAPGLAWTAKLRSYTPWTPPSDTGVEASWAPGAQRAGKIGRAKLTVSAPGGSLITARAGLPAGAWVDLDRLRANPAVLAVEQNEDTLELRLRELGPAEILEIPVSVQPGFAGTFATGPLSLQVRGPRSIDLDLPPSPWRVAL